MNEELLRQFQGDVHTREAFREFLLDFIGKRGVQKIFAREDISGIADAHELIISAFDQLEIDYGIKNKEPVPTSEAR